MFDKLLDIALITDGNFFTKRTYKNAFCSINVYKFNVWILDITKKQI